MPSSTAFCTAGAMADESCGNTINTSACCAIRLSMSVNCFCADDCASAEIYLSPDAATAALIAASSVFQRSSWKLDQDTPMTLPFASATAAKQNDKAAAVNKAVANLLMTILPAPEPALSYPPRYRRFFSRRQLPLNLRIAPWAADRAYTDQTCCRSNPS